MRDAKRFLLMVVNAEARHRQLNTESEAAHERFRAQRANTASLAEDDRATHSQQMLMRRHRSYRHASRRHYA